MPGSKITIRLKQQGPILPYINLNCAEGEILVIVWPSGSGKTTILRSICGIYQPESGNINRNSKT